MLPITVTDSTLLQVGVPPYNVRPSWYLFNIR
ncbi:hypothetical protein VPHF99_0283 [Vibrio phage F99]